MQQEHARELESLKQKTEKQIELKMKKQLSEMDQSYSLK